MTQPTVDEVTQLARRFRVEINMGDGTDPDWQLFPGIREFKPTITPTRQEDDGYEDDGWARQTTTGMAWGLELKASHRADENGVAFNAVQEHVKQAVTKYGKAGEVHLRWYDRNGLPEAYEGRALVEWEPDGGDPKATDIVTVKFSGQGPRLDIPNPADNGDGGGGE